MLGSLTIIAVGCLLVWGGLRLIRSCETKPGDTSFARAYSPRVLGYSLGYVLVFLGLLAALISAPMYWLAHR